MKECITRTKIDPAIIGDIVVGSVLVCACVEVCVTPSHTLISCIVDLHILIHTHPHTQGKNGQRANEARIAQFFAGIPETVPLHTVNRQCSSGLQAVAECAAAIRSGMYDVGLACGVESMSSAVIGWYDTHGSSYISICECV
jgi:hypothetical protein